MEKNGFDNLLIAVEGIDGVGKSTLTINLTTAFNESALESGFQKLDPHSRDFLRKQLTGLISESSLEKLLDQGIFGGAVRFEDLEINDALYHAKKSLPNFDVNFSYYVYLASAIQKDHILRILLPYFNVIADRHIYSVYAHHSSVSAEVESVSLENFPVLIPDLVFLLKTREDVRVRRLVARGNMNEKDKRKKEPGSQLDMIEQVFQSFNPIILDTTFLDSKDLSDYVFKLIRDGSRVKRKEKWNQPVLRKKSAAFDSELYLRVQTSAILKRIEQTPEGGSVYVEFGGKSYDDRHASRVLPGYDKDAKVRLLRDLNQKLDIVVAVSARDLLKPRIRGDSQLFYNRETLRMVRALAEAGIKLDHGVVTMVRSDYDERDQTAIENFVVSARSELGVEFDLHGFIEGYPDAIKVLSSDSPFGECRKLETNNSNILVLSPGGGSGKFGVCASQLYHDFVSGINSFFIKFETFPVFNLSAAHPLNIAFSIATADLGNVIVEEEGGDKASYDKDVENFRLLIELTRRFCPDFVNNPISTFRGPSCMGVNKLTSGFIDEDAIKEAAKAEIKRRLLRYEEEIRKGIETGETLEHAKKILRSTFGGFAECL